MKNLRLLFFSLIVLIIAACSEDYLDPTLSTQRDIASIETAQDLEGVLLGAYERMSLTGYYGRNHVVYGDLRSDNAYSTGASGRFVNTGNFVLNPDSGDPDLTWDDIYEAIANTNVIIDADVTSETEQGLIDHIKGEAYAIRAISHMDLLAWFGQQYSGGTLGVPYISEYLGEDLTPNRNTVAEVWENVEADLNMASSLMNEQYNETSARFTTYGVAALKTRYYLYTGDYAAIIPEAEAVINSGAFSLASGADYAEMYVSTGGSASVFELAFNSADNLGSNSLAAITKQEPYGDIVVTQDLLDLYETGDVRRDLYGDGTGPTGLPVIRILGKYPNSTADDNVLVIRYAEVILNYSEALFRTGQESQALTELNKITGAVGATDYTQVTLDNILLERRKELAMEGFRFHDLMRNELDIMKVDDGQTFTGDRVAYGDSKLAFPIPQTEINGNSQIEQNPGY